MIIVPPKYDMGHHIPNKHLWYSIIYMKHIVLRPHLRALDHKLNDLFNKILYCKKINIPVPSWLPLRLVPIMISLIAVGHNRTTTESMVPCFFLSGKHHSESFTIANTSWLTATGHVCHTWPHIFSVCRSEALEFSRFFSSLSGTRVVHVVHVVHVVNLYDVIRYHVRVKTTFEFSSLRILL